MTKDTAFGLRLRRLREAQGLTQPDLAAATGLHQTYISQLETGKRSDPSYSAVLALAKALGVPVGVLMGEEVDDQRLEELVSRLTEQHRGMPPHLAEEIRTIVREELRAFLRAQGKQ